MSCIPRWSSPSPPLCGSFLNRRSLEPRLLRVRLCHVLRPLLGAFLERVKFLVGALLIAVVATDSLVRHRIRSALRKRHHMLPGGAPPIEHAQAKAAPITSLPEQADDLVSTMPRCHLPPHSCRALEHAFLGATVCARDEITAPLAHQPSATFEHVAVTQQTAQPCHRSRTQPIFVHRSTCDLPQSAHVRYFAKRPRRVHGVQL